MKRIVSLVLSAVLLLSCMMIPVYAEAGYNSDVTVSATLDKSSIPAGTAQTVILSLRISKQEDLFSIGYKINVPNGWSISSIESGSNDIVFSLDDGHYSLKSGVVSWYKAVNKSTDSNGTIGIIKISVPADTAAGDYTVSVDDIELATSNKNNDNAWMKNKSASATLSIKGSKVLESIIIKTAPKKTAYKAGENFDPAGMVVTANYSDKSSQTVTDYTVKDGKNLTAGKTSVTISYTDNGVTKTVSQPITVESKSRTLLRINVKTAPNKTKYLPGEKFDATGMVITAYYSDDTSLNLKYYTIVDGDKLKAGQTVVIISYSEDGVTKTATQAITVAAESKTLSKISIKSAPSKTKYIQGQNFDASGMVVVAAYTDGTTATVTDYTVTDGENLKAGKTSVKISYTENGITKTVNQSITVEAKALTKISVKTAPKKTKYVAGENFDKTGMVVVATYNDGTTKTVSDYEITDGKKLSESKKSVKISYTENGVTKTTTQSITVSKQKSDKSVSGIEITSNPAKTAYVAGESFDTEGMVITARYSDNTSEIVTDYTVIDGDNLEAGQTYVTISYTENGVTKTVTQAITVDVKKASELVIETAPTKTTYTEGENFDPAGMVLTLRYNDNTTETITDFVVIDGENLKAGQISVTINYTSPDGITVSVTQNITVESNVIHVSDVKLNTESLTLKVNDTASLVATVSPADATNKNVIWSSSNENAVTVDENGNLKAVGEGEAVITATTLDGNKTASCTVSVEPASLLWLYILIAVLALIAAAAIIFFIVKNKKKEEDDDGIEE